MQKYKFVKRLLRNRFYNLLLSLIELIPISINRSMMIKKNHHPWEYLTAFVVLFPKVERHLIPPKSFKYY